MRLDLSYYLGYLGALETLAGRVTLPLKLLDGVSPHSCLVAAMIQYCGARICDLAPTTPLREKE
ncbi:hypothetical protein [Anaeromyxobacter paludicola]|uniref:hypothetical protein n=1 Tax=Anaeromyxobacter paludicola TaxID=2918171 RepID=UPI0020BFFCC2|nr:hypothetical protein [Anaeromyxobacter paludicola]